MIEFAVEEMDKWFKNETVLRGIIGNNIEIPDGYDKHSVCSEVQLYADGMGAEIKADSGEGKM